MTVVDGLIFVFVVFSMSFLLSWGVIKLIEREPKTKKVVRKMGDSYLALMIKEDGSPYASLQQYSLSKRYYWSCREVILFAKWFNTEKEAMDAIEIVRQGYDAYHDVEVKD